MADCCCCCCYHRPCLHLAYLLFSLGPLEELRLADKPSGSIFSHLQLFPKRPCKRCLHQRLPGLHQHGRSSETFCNCVNFGWVFPWLLPIVVHSHVCMAKSGTILCRQQHGAILSTHINVSHMIATQGRSWPVVSLYVDKLRPWREPGDLQHHMPNNIKH